MTSHATPHHPKQIVVVKPNGTLSDVFVYVKTGISADAEYPAPTTPVVIDQKGCMYHPRVFGIMVGKIEAWHEKYGTQTATVTVQGNAAKTVDFTYAAKTGG